MGKTNPESSLLIASLKGENKKLHAKIAKLEATSISMKHRIAALEKETKKERKIVLSWKSKE